MSGKPTRRPGRGPEAHAEVRRGGKAHPEGQQVHPVVWKGLTAPNVGPVTIGRPPGSLGGVGRPMRITGKGQKAHPKDTEELGGPPVGPGGVGSPVWWYGNGL